MPAASTSFLGRIVTSWGVLSVLAILGNAIRRVLPIALQPLKQNDLSSLHWVAYAVWAVYMAYAEGYKAFQLKFSPLIVRRAIELGNGRMTFMRVLLATLIGGSVASITWAYTAEGIVKFMHQYKLEVFIPLVIGVFILMAVLHIRSTKMRRQTELFEDTLLDNFHADIIAKYGDQ